MSDPEYEAQFTRGYTGPPIGPPPGLAKRVDDRAAVASLAPGLEPSPTAEPDPPAELASSNEPEPAPAPAPRGRNPWSVALLLIAVGMVAAGVALLRLYAMTNANGYGISDQTAVLLQSNLGTALITAGLAGVIAWLVLLALRGSDRRGPA